MRELERDSPSLPRAPTRLAIVGRGRLGTALVRALDGAASVRVLGPLGRGADAAGCDAALLCVPDGQISVAASQIAPDVLVGHASGATTLEVLAPRERFAVHPLMTVTPAGASFAGAGAAVAGSSERALSLAVTIAGELGMRPVEVADSDRPVYHAAASVASNFLVTLEAVAEGLARTAGIDRALLVPLVRATVENWAALGPDRALTGPVARGDSATVERQRAAIAARAPEHLAVFDALVTATRALAARGRGTDDRVATEVRAA